MTVACTLVCQCGTGLSVFTEQTAEVTMVLCPNPICGGCHEVAGKVLQVGLVGKDGSRTPYDLRPQGFETEYTIGTRVIESIGNRTGSITEVSEFDGERLYVVLFDDGSKFFFFDFEVLKETWNTPVS